MPMCKLFIKNSYSCKRVIHLKGLSEIFLSMLLSEAEMMVPAEKHKELVVRDKGNVVWTDISFFAWDVASPH